MSVKKKRVTWNKGKTKEDYPQLSNSGVKKGNIPWNKGVKTGVVPSTAFKEGHTHSEEFKEEQRDRMEKRKTRLFRKIWLGGCFYPRVFSNRRFY